MSEFKGSSEDKSVEKNNHQTNAVKDSWKCQFCDNKNDYTMTICEVCEAYKPIPREESCVNDDLTLNVSYKDDNKDFGTQEKVSKESLDEDNLDSSSNISFDKRMSSMTTPKDFKICDKALLSNIDLSDEDVSNERQRHVYNHESYSTDYSKDELTDEGRYNTGRDHVDHKSEINDQHKGEDSHRRHPFTSNITLSRDNEVKNTLNFSNKKEEMGLGSWTCGKCTKVNVYEDELCKVCRECGPYYDKWRCEQCTMINDKLEDDCQACHQRNPFIKTCPHCHLRNINHKYDKMCEKCRVKDNENPKNYAESYHKKDNDEGSLKVEKWSCSKCSLLNSFDHERCAACDNVGPHFNKWRCERCTFFNDDWRSICHTCHFIKSDITKTYHHEPHNNEDVTVKTNELNKGMRYDRRLCKKCGSIASVNKPQCQCGVFSKPLFKHDLIIPAAVNTSKKNKPLYNRKMKVINTKNIIRQGVSDKVLSINKTYNEPEDVDEKKLIQTMFQDKITEKGDFILKTPKNDKMISFLPKVKINKEFDKSLCRNCRGVLLASEEKLCCICSKNCYLCHNNKCKKLLFLPKVRCTYCGKDKYSDGSTKDGPSWFCSWRGCTRVNEGRCTSCIICTCSREVSDCERKCSFCGWIDFINTKCIKCKLNFELSEDNSKKWQCSWKECSSVNDDNDMCCSKCHCFREDLGKLKCRSCGFVQSRRSKCSKCQRNYNPSSNEKVESNVFFPQMSKKNLNNFCKSNYFTKLPLTDVVQNDKLTQTESGVDEITQDVKEKVINISCIHCESVVLDSEGELCLKCREKFYICPRNVCRKLIEVDNMWCSDCGVKTWRCSWKDCRQFNEETRDCCGNCCCFRYLNNRRIECVKCGWIKTPGSVCRKCGDSL